jgi:hypothetical protein
MAEPATNENLLRGRLDQADLHGAIIRAVAPARIVDPVRSFGASACFGVSLGSPRAARYTAKPCCDLRSAHAKRGGCLFGQLRDELLAAGDVEFLVGVAEVRGDRTDPDE